MTQDTPSLRTHVSSYTQARTPPEQTFAVSERCQRLVFYKITGDSRSFLYSDLSQVVGRANQEIVFVFREYEMKVTGTNLQLVIDHANLHELSALYERDPAIATTDAPYIDRIDGPKHITGIDGDIPKP